jgi:hypothetical protein
MRAPKLKEMLNVFGFFVAVAVVNTGLSKAIDLGMKKLRTTKLAVPFADLDNGATAYREEYLTHTCYFLEVGPNQMALCKDRPKTEKKEPKKAE